MSLLETVDGINGHDFSVVETWDEDALIECQACLIRELIEDQHDAPDRVELLTPECRVEWLREADGGFHGIALRNASGFRGRELIAVDEDDEIQERVRVYDDDAPLLADLLAEPWGGRL